MKKVILVLAVLVVAGFIPFNLQNSVNIKARYFDVCQQFAPAAGGNRWKEILGLHNNNLQISNANPGFSVKIANQNITVKNLNANVFEVVNNLHHISYQYLYTVIPGAGTGNATTIVINHPANGFKWLMEQLSPSVSPTYLALSVKAFMENPIMYYGFTINEINSEANYMAVKKATIAVKNKYNEIAGAAKIVNAFVNQNNLKAVSPLSASYYPIKTDSLQILVGLAVNKPLTSTGEISFMQLHAGKVLVGNFKGKYADRRKIYAAMEKYMDDHSLLRQISPFETYLSNKAPISDSDIVNMQLSYPVL